MKLNVLLYNSAPNPNDIPGTWPAQVVQIPDTAPAPTLPWQQMTVQQYKDYVAAHQAEYDAWLADQITAKDSNIATLASQYDAAISAMQTFDRIDNPTTTQAINAVQTHNKILLKLVPLLRKVYIDSLQ